MKKQKIDRNFVSEIDKRLAEFNSTHKKSPAQTDEIEKYQAIYQQRDEMGISRKEEDVVWDGF